MLSHPLKVIAKYRGEIFCKFRKRSDKAFNSRDMDVTNEPPEGIQGARIDYVNDDLTERQQLIKSVLTVCQSDPGLDGMRFENDLKFLEQAVCWCTLMVMDIKQLRYLNERLHSNDQKRCYSDLIECLMYAGELVYWFGRDPAEPWAQGRAVIRNEAEKNRAIMRDQGLCVATHNPADEACHIVPLWTLKWHYTMNKTVITWDALFGPYTVAYVRDRFMSQDRNRENRVAERNIVDKCCNMICLSGQMRQCWEKGLFTFEPVGYCRRSKGAGEVSEISSLLSSTSISDSTATTAHTDSMPSTQEATVKARTPDTNDDEASDLFNEGRRLQESDIDARKEYGTVLRVRWLLKTTTLSSLMDSAPPLNTDPQELQEPWEELHEELEGRSVLPKNGDIIRIWAHDPQELPDWTALELRWTALRIHCLSGRANPEKYNPGYNNAYEQFEIDVSDYNYVNDDKVALELRARISAFWYAG